MRSDLPAVHDDPAKIAFISVVDVLDLQVYMCMFTTAMPTSSI